MSNDKRYPPSAKKLRKAREKGDFIRTRYLSTLFATGVIWFFVNRWFDKSASGAEKLAAWSLDSERLERSTLQIVKQFSGPIFEVSAVLVAVWLVVIIAELTQTRGHINSPPVGFNIARLSPFAGLKRILNIDDELSLSGCVRGWFGLICGTLLKISVVTGTLAYTCAPFFGAGLTPFQLLLVLRYRLVNLILASATLTAIAVVFDLWRAAQRRNKRLMMDFNELTQELRESEGNQEVKAMRKHVHQEIMREADLNRVRTAKVLLTS